MSLKLWTFVGVTLPGENWQWAAIEEGATPDAEQLRMLNLYENPGSARASHYRFQCWLDADLSWSWVEHWRSYALSPQTVSDSDIPVHQAEVLSIWQYLSAMLRAANVPPYALAIYRDAWQARVGTPTWGEPYGVGGWWRTEIERISGVRDGITTPGGKTLGCTVFRLLGDRGYHEGGDCGRDEHRLWLTADGLLDSSRISPPTDAVQAGRDTDCSSRLGSWHCAEWAWYPYCAGGCLIGARANTEDLYALAPLRWYYDLAVEILQWFRGVGPLGAVWWAHVDALDRNVATLLSAGLPGSDISRLSGLREERVAAAESRALNEITTATRAVAGGAGLAGVLGTGGTAFLGAVSAVAELGARLLLALGGTAVARFEDVFGRPWPVMEPGQLADNEERARAIMPAMPGFGLVGPGVTQQKQCYTAGAEPPPNCWFPTMQVQVPGPEKSGKGWLVLGALAAAGVGGTFWLTRHKRR